MIQTAALKVPTDEPPDEENTSATSPAQRKKSRRGLLWQLLCFCLVGGLNTIVDLLLLNVLLWLWPTQDTIQLLAYNSLAYAFGAVNSFLLNKYWTFQKKQQTTYTEVSRFILTTACGIICNDFILWLAGKALHPAMINATLWTNASKVLAIGGTFMISYLGMRLWVFAHHPVETPVKDHTPMQSAHSVLSPAHDKAVISMQNENSALSSAHDEALTPLRHSAQTDADVVSYNHSLSVILPAYNEEQVIASTLKDVLTALNGKIKDFEVIVVNDGSTDQTATIVQSIACLDVRVHLLNHLTNQGYGATLADGFAAAQKELTFFMDSDGQFDIRDLFQFFSFVDEYDAVIGYRMHRQDSWMRKFNAWGWKVLIDMVLGIHVRDIDCAFKLLRTDFLHAHPLESRGAMINAELLYKLTNAGATYCQIDVQHLPRRGGQATGAHPRVILRALHELFFYQRQWQSAKKGAIQQQMTTIQQNRRS